MWELYTLINLSTKCVQVLVSSGPCYRMKFESMTFILTDLKFKFPRSLDNLDPWINHICLNESNGILGALGTNWPKGKQNSTIKSGNKTKYARTYSDRGDRSSLGCWKSCFSSNWPFRVAVSDRLCVFVVFLRKFWQPLCRDLIVYHTIVCLSFPSRFSSRSFKLTVRAVCYDEWPN